jgi:hypothetical protein
MFPIEFYLLTPLNQKLTRDNILMLLFILPICLPLAFLESAELVVLPAPLLSCHVCLILYPVALPLFYHAMYA